ncbi:recQ-mediated genome instability protein 1 [Chamberlinius hualienensis]
MENQILSWLKTTHHVIVSVEWVNACIHWLQQEQVFSAKELPTAVYSQWLFSDLHSLEFKCLPDKLNETSETTLHGFYALQIDSVEDISKSSYQQLLECQRKDYSNAEVTADTDEKRNKVDVPKHRLLKLKLTDGVQNVTAHEYRPITCLNVQLLPGTKMLVYGTVQCYYGTLMLTENNCKILGGSVTELAETNSHLAIIKSKLNRVNEAAGDQHPRLAQNGNASSLPEITIIPQRFDFQVNITVDYNGLADVIATDPPKTFSKTYSGSTGSALPSNDYEIIDADDDENFFDVAAISVTNSFQPDPDDFINDDEEFEEFLRSAATVSKRAKVSQPPFVYLNSLPSLPTDKEIRVTIKGFILSFLSGLRTCNGAAWGFKVLINDGTASIQAEFADNVLTKLIGITAMEFTKLKLSYENDENCKKRVNEIVKITKKTLQDLSCLFDIEIKPNSSTAMIINTKDVSQDVHQYLKDNN